MSDTPEKGRRQTDEHQEPDHLEHYRPNDDQPQDEQSEEARRALASYSSLPQWIFFGIVIGGGFGVIMDNILLGAGAGLAIGALIGFLRNGSGKL